MDASPHHPRSRARHGGGPPERSRRRGGHTRSRTELAAWPPARPSIALEKWLSTGHRPPASHTVARPEGADPAALLTDCRLDK
ncbi:hypothetical protein DIZ27_14960 [Streptomyces sp. NWU339]|nr:hypothetical protein DIZ27_14960 [Streptomyces sp. NWU339]